MVGKGLYPAYLVLRCVDQELGRLDHIKYLMMQITQLLPKSIDENVDQWNALGETI